MFWGHNARQRIRFSLLQGTDRDGNQGISRGISQGISRVVRMQMPNGDIRCLLLEAAGQRWMFMPGLDLPGF